VAFGGSCRLKGGVDRSEAAEIGCGNECGEDAQGGERSEEPSPKPSDVCFEGGDMAKESGGRIGVRIDVRSGGRLGRLG
jgi:hypothetical protein